MVETKKMTSSEVHNELDLITLRLLNLSQELIHAKLRLEEMTKQANDYYLINSNKNVKYFFFKSQEIKLN